MIVTMVQKESYKTELLDWRDEEYPEYQLASGVTIDGEERWLEK